MSTSNDDDHRMIIVMLKTYIDLTVMRHANQMRNSLWVLPILNKMAFQESSMGQYEIIVFKEFQGENQSLPCAFPIAFPAIICQQGNAFHYISGTVIQFISGLYSPRFRGQCLFLFGQCTSKVHHGANMSQQCNSARTWRRTWRTGPSNRKRNLPRSLRGTDRSTMGYQRGYQAAGQAACFSWGKYWKTMVVG